MGKRVPLVVPCKRQGLLVGKRRDHLGDSAHLTWEESEPSSLHKAGLLWQWFFPLHIFDVLQLSCLNGKV